MENIPNLNQVKTYFNKRMQEHGASPRGSDWNSTDSQYLRFDQLTQVIEPGEPFSLLDYGCGYGALADYLSEKGYQVDYYGYDILESAIETARRAHAGKPQRTFFTDKGSLRTCDYVLASGIFNFRGDRSFDDWTKYVLDVLHEFDGLSKRGFSSNFLTKYSDADKMRADLYYGDPCFLFDYCKRNFSLNVALLHDYNLYDFTILVRKE